MLSDFEAQIRESIPEEKLPLLRLKIILAEKSAKNTVNIARLSREFNNKVANPNQLILFSYIEEKKKSVPEKSFSLEGFKHCEED